MHYIKDAKGVLVPISLVHLADLLEFADLLEDEMVRKIMNFYKELSARCSARGAVKTPTSPAP
ncbi:hypothetical protein [Bartonella jaculi]|uniref:Uncharacterized protein n=1 Tax=Bartonella jaculi TaxID=686226 RepID=A0ABP9N4V3_9HYPH